MTRNTFINATARAQARSPPATHFVSRAIIVHAPPPGNPHPPHRHQPPPQLRPPQVPTTQVVNVDEPPPPPPASGDGNDPVTHMMYHTDVDNTSDEDAFNLVIDNIYINELDYYLLNDRSHDNIFTNPPSFRKFDLYHLRNIGITGSIPCHRHKVPPWVYPTPTADTPPSTKRLYPPLPTTDKNTVLPSSSQTSEHPPTPHAHSRTSALAALLKQPPSLYQLLSTNQITPFRHQSLMMMMCTKFKVTHKIYVIHAHHTLDIDLFASLHKFIVDSGANRYICNNKHLFIYMTKYTGVITHVPLGNRNTKVPIQGIGTIDIKVCTNHTIYLHNVI